MTRGGHSSVAGGDAGGSVVLLVCFVLALGLHVGLVPALGGGWGGTRAPEGRGPQVQWAPSVAGGVAGQAMPLALLIDKGRAPGNGVGQGVEVRVRWSRQDDGGGEGLEVARWDAWSAVDVEAEAGGRTLAWGWSVPEDLSGPGWLLAQVRPAGMGAEDEAGWSPVAARTLWIEPATPPEVGVQEVLAPRAVAAGGVLRVGYTLVNRGPGWVRGPVEDRVELWPVAGAEAAPGAEPGAEPWTVSTAARREPMAPGDTWDHQAPAVRLPASAVPGVYELVVTPGGPGAVAQRHAIELRPASHPDLAVAGFEAPPTVTAGRPFALTFAVENRAPRETGPGLWGDRVYLSVDDVLDAGDVLLKSEPRGKALAGFEAYASPEHAVTVAPEHAVSSVMFLIVSVDDENNVDEGAFEGNNTRARPVTVVQPEDADAETPDLKLGHEEAPADRVAVAWIAYEDLQELQARRSVTHQPAVQARVEPTPDAPLRSDASPDVAGPDQPGVVDAAAPATPPRPPALPAVEAEVVEEAEKAEEATLATEAAPALAAQGPATLVPEAVALGGVAPGVQAEVLDAPEDSSQDLPAKAAAAADTDGPADAQAVPPTAPAPPTPPDAPAPQADAATTPVPTPEPRPSSTPRSDREADPTAPVAVSVVRPGTVLVGRGLEVRTVRPRFSVTARALSVPSNPEVVLTFNADGTVRLAELRTSTGFDNIDGPLLSSLYAWTARGPRLAQEPEARVALTILFREPVKPARSKDREDTSESESQSK